MKKFNDVRIKKEKPVFSKRVDGFSVEVRKNSGRFEAYVDNDLLDSFKSQNDAVKAASEFIKQYRD
jgi:hypothetical protein